MNIGCVILAAGQGRRMGGVAKAALKVPGESGENFLVAIATTLLASHVDARVVVAGGVHQRITESMACALGLPCVINRQWTSAMASSVAVGFRYAQQHFSRQIAALLWPVDIPLIRGETLASLWHAAAPDRVVIPTLSQRGGHPPLVGRDFWKDLAVCDAMAQGAQTVFRQHADRILRIPVEDPGILSDYDRPCDL